MYKCILKPESVNGLYLNLNSIITQEIDFKVQVFSTPKNT